jgi:hypothetical protein
LTNSHFVKGSVYTGDAAESGWEGHVEFKLKGALNKYHRMRMWRQITIGFAPAVGLAVAWFLGFGQTDTLICIVGSLVFILCGCLELRLKTIQIRLAGIADEIDALKGNEPEQNLVLELNDW